MNTSTETARPAAKSLTKEWISLGWYYIGGRRGLLLFAIAFVGAWLAYNWSWLVVIGVAPLILALAPCAIMCGLGLCMHMKGSQSRSTSFSTDVAKTDAQATSMTLDVETPSKRAVTASAEEPGALRNQSCCASEEPVAAPTQSETSKERS